MESTKPGDVLGSRYHVLNKIGEGAFATVFKATDTLKRKLVALKVGNLRQVCPEEIEIMKTMSGEVGFPKYFSHGTHKDQRYVAMQLLHKSVHDVQYVDNKVLSKSSIASLIKGGLKRLRALHLRGFVHRDLKLQHFMYSKKSSRVYLTDFGMATNCANADDEFIPCRYQAAGNLRFCSLRAHYFESLGPMDDLESLVYIFICLVQGELPWDSAVLVKGDIVRSVRKLKSGDAWISNLPEELRILLVYTRSQNVSSKPDYTFMKGMVRQWRNKQASSPSRSPSRVRSKSLGYSGDLKKKKRDRQVETTVTPEYNRKMTPFDILEETQVLPAYLPKKPALAKLLESKGIASQAAGEKCLLY